MIKSNLADYLTNQLNLDDVSVTEIENLISESPSSDLYRMLLMHKMNGLHIHESALLSNDRVLLENIITGKSFTLSNQAPEKHVVQNHNVSSPVYQERIIINETVQDVLTDEATNTEQTSATLSADLIQAEDQIRTEYKEIHPETSSLKEQTAQNPIAEDANAYSELDMVNQDISIPIKEVDCETTHKQDVKKASKGKSKSFKLREFGGISEFSLWLISLERDDLEKRLKKEAKKDQKRQLAASARKSITKSDEIISESLAQILENQKHFDEAKKMYTQLMHKYPEKSRYFAEKIDKLINS